MKSQSKRTSAVTTPRELTSTFSHRKSVHAAAGDLNNLKLTNVPFQKLWRHHLTHRTSSNCPELLSAKVQTRPKAVSTTAKMLPIRTSINARVPARPAHVLELPRRGFPNQSVHIQTYKALEGSTHHRKVPRTIVHTPSSWNAAAGHQSLV